MVFRKLEKAVAVWGGENLRGLPREGGGAKLRYVPRNPGKPNFWAGYPGKLPGYPGGCLKS